MTPPPLRQIALQPLTAEAFEPFGQVTDLCTGERRNRVADAFGRTPQAVEPRLWIATVRTPAVLPLKLASLERHPHSTQTFLPVDSVHYLVAVCHPQVDGQPDLATLQAFEAAPGQGVTYARNVWHHGLSVLEAPGRFVVCMSFTADGGDDVFVPLESAIEFVRRPAAPALG